MNIVEIKALEGGAHRNASGDFKTVPEGWAMIPDGMNTPSFPFGEIEATEINGMMTITRWIAGTKPKVEDIEPPISEFEQLRADIDYIALMTEVAL